MTDINGKIVIITGASSGIGAAIAVKLAKAGMKVVALARRKDKLDKLAKGYEGKIYPIKGDVSNKDDMLNVFNWTQTNLGPLYALINNAGIVYAKPILESEEDEWRKLFETNLISLTLFTKEAVKVMTENDTSGVIINMNSVCGHSVSATAAKLLPGLGIYFSAKHGITGFTEALRLELANAGSKIRVTSISPGLIESEMSENYTSQLPHLDGEDVGNAIEYILKQRSIVNIAELIIRPVGETSF